MWIHPVNTFFVFTVSIKKKSSKLDVDFITVTKGAWRVDSRVLLQLLLEKSLAVFSDLIGSLLVVCGIMYHRCLIGNPAYFGRKIKLALSFPLLMFS